MKRRIKISTIVVVVLLIVYGLSYGFSTFDSGGNYDIVYGSTGIERVNRRTGGIKTLFQSDQKLYFAVNGATVYVAEGEKLFAVAISGKSRRILFEGEGKIVPSEDEGLSIRSGYIYFSQLIDDRLVPGRLHLRKNEYEKLTVLE